MPKLKLDYFNAAQFITPSWERGGLILQVGVGGTGSWLAHDLVRILERTGNRSIRYVLCDPDTVEFRNTERQNFCPTEVGRNKAEAMATRLAHAFGWDVSALAKPFDRTMLDNLKAANGPVLIVGCVDNAAARRSIHDTVRSKNPEYCWWLDCGNHASSGQVLFGNQAIERTRRYPFPGKCSVWLAPSLQHPEILIDESVSTESCAEIIDPQSLTVNRMVAAIAADYALRFLMGLPLKYYASYFDLASMTVQSKYLPKRPSA